MTPAERAADTPKRCIQCRKRWATGILLINGRRQPRCEECIAARKKAEARR